MWLFLEHLFGILAFYLLCVGCCLLEPPWHRWPVIWLESMLLLMVDFYYLNANRFPSIFAVSKAFFIEKSLLLPNSGKVLPYTAFNLPLRSIPGPSIFIASSLLEPTHAHYYFITIYIYKLQNNSIFINYIQYVCHSKGFHFYAFLLFYCNFFPFNYIYWE